MPDVKAIPTRWNGVSFRSRLEARWAVFLSTLELDWVYEYEGFKLPSGWYVPDFYIPARKLFFEVKPNRPLLPEEETKLEELADTVGEEVLVDWSGMQPFTLNADLVYCSGHFDEIRQAVADTGIPNEPHLWCACPVCGEARVEPGGTFALMCPSGKSVEHDRLVALGPMKLRHGPKVEHAYRVALKHRFDYERSK